VEPGNREGQSGRERVAIGQVAAGGHKIIKLLGDLLHRVVGSGQVAVEAAGIDADARRRVRGQV
jgi:hypothetical protein